jgi:hypothetical protein
LLVVVLYIGNSNPIATHTIVFDGRTNSNEGSITIQKQGIHPNKLVRYSKDVEKLQEKMKSGQQRVTPLPFVATEKGPDHYIFVNRDEVPVMSLAAVTRLQAKSPTKANQDK